MSSTWYVKGINQTTEVTKKVPNSSFEQERLEHSVSTRTTPFPAIAPPSPPCHPRSSILIDGHFEDLLAEKQALGTGKESTNGADVRISFVRQSATLRRLLTDAM